jgi:hypothetical protein
VPLAGRDRAFARSNDEGGAMAKIVEERRVTKDGLPLIAVKVEFKNAADLNTFIEHCKRNGLSDLVAKMNLEDLIFEPQEPKQ